MQSKIRRNVALLHTTAILLGLGVFASSLPGFPSSPLLVLGLFATAVAASRLLDIQLPQGGRLHIDTAVIIASILLFPLPDTLVVSILGILVSMLIRQVKLQFGATMYPLSIKIITIYMATNVFYAVGGKPGEIEPLLGIVSLLLLCGAYSVIDLGLDQLTIAANRGTRYMRGFVSSVRFLGPIYLSLSSLGILLSIMYKGMGYWGLLLFFLPLMVTRVSFKSFLDIRNIYRKTIEALSNAIEAQNSNRSGHGRRVANYSVDIAKEIGIHGRELELIGYAALLHDIGMLGVDEDSLDHLLEQVSAQSGEAPHAIIGAEVVEQVDFLRGAADMVRTHHYPIDRLKRPDDIPLGARIINVASYFDKLTKTDVLAERLTAYQAISRIKKDQGIRFDPKVVRALITILRKQGKLMEYVS
ncbi:MAG: HD-GYP domain-containing protein [Candidatus Aquicultor sp.]